MASSEPKLVSGVSMSPALASGKHLAPTDAGLPAKLLLESCRIYYGGCAQVLQAWQELFESRQKALDEMIEGLDRQVMRGKPIDGAQVMNQQWSSLLQDISVLGNKIVTIGQEHTERMTRITTSVQITDQGKK